MFKGVKRKSSAFGLMALACASVSAQVPPVPPPEVRQQGEQQQRLQEERDAAQRRQFAPPSQPLGAPPHDSAQPWPGDESPCVVIREISLDGPASRAFGWTIDDLIAGPDAAIGRCLGVEGLNVAAARAQARLQRQGYVTSRILHQPQDLSDGRLKLVFVAGRIGAIRFADGTGPRATALNATPARPGDILNLRDIEQALENFKRVPTVTADIQLVPGAAPDQTDLVIAWQQAFALRLTATLDDSGTKSTGKYQGSATLSYDHWWTLNDLFYVTVNHDLGGGDTGSRGTRASTVHYSVPWGYSQLSLNASRSSYHQSVAGLNQDYVYSGTSENADVGLSRIVHRDASRRTSVSLKGWMRRSGNAIDDTEIETQRRATGGWSIGLTHRESIDAATLELNLAHKRGTAAFNATPAPEEAFGEGTSRLEVSTVDANLVLPFRLADQALRYQGLWRAQWNRTPLTPQERFAIGGRYTVRGFDGESSLSAERGWLVRNDLGLALGASGQQAYVGLDYGQVRGPATAWQVGRHLAGAVLGLRGEAGHISYDFFVGKPVSRPEYFRTASVTAGFSLTTSF